MEHIRQYDWCNLDNDTSFLDENGLDNCVIEKIIRNNFYDPLLSESDAEPDPDNRSNIDWEEICKHRFKVSKDNHHTRFIQEYVPCLRAIPPYPKLSKFSIQQQNQLLKVICSESPHVLTSEFVLRPTKIDRKVFEELKADYEAERIEYAEWAKSLWASSHCTRALRPKQPIETIYEAEYKMKAYELDSFPKAYRLAAQIPFEGKEDACVMTYQKDLVNVTTSNLPQIEYPDLNRKFCIMKACSVPEPCAKHPCRFVLPNEKSLTMLPITEIHRELAQFASEHGVQYIVSEKALRCFVETDRRWTFPLSVCDIIGPDGEKSNIVVMGSDFSTQKETAQIRSYRAYRHLLEFSLIPQTERDKYITNINDSGTNGKKTEEMIELSSDEEDDNSLFIDAGDLGIKEEPTTDFDIWDSTNMEDNDNDHDKENTASNENGGVVDGLKDLGVYNCTCKDSLFEKPPPRSFRKWKLSNKTSKENFDIIIHCSHKAKTRFSEVIMEPIPEYQVDLGGSKLSKQMVKGLALSLALRKNATLLTVRVEASSGDVARYDIATAEEWNAMHGDRMDEISATLHAAFSQLQGLLPGSYVLQHEPSHGPNAMLYVARPNAQDLTMQFNFEQLGQDDEAKAARTPPTLEPVLLPYHKSRRILPCAFTPYSAQVWKERRKPPSRQKPPPNAIKWPKKKKKKSKKN